MISDPGPLHHYNLLTVFLHHIQSLAEASLFQAESAFAALALYRRDAVAGRADMAEALT